jgi:hypothetical protein
MAPWRLRASQFGCGVGALLFFGGLFTLSLFHSWAGMVAVGGYLLGVVGFAVGFQRQVCPNCGKWLISVGTDVKHCRGCGTAYAPDGGADPTGPDDAAW